MSYKLVDKILHNYRGPRRALPVLLSLARRADANGMAWPSIGSIAAECRYSARQVKRHVSTLIAGGYLSPIGSTAGGRAKSVRYVVTANPDTDVRLSGAGNSDATVTLLDPETVTPVSPFTAQKGDIGVQERVTSVSRKGDTSVTRSSKESVIESTNSRATHPRVRSVKSKRDTETDAAFVAFWQAYPRKTAKVAAVKAWERLNPDPDTCARIVRQVEAAKQTIEWRKDGGAFVPYPATYLNGRRFDDELGAAAAPQKLTVAL